MRVEKLVKKYLAENELTWKQGLIDGSSYELMKTYKIQSGPHSLLIAPDGTLIVNGLKGDELYEAVSDALANEY